MLCFYKWIFAFSTTTAPAQFSCRVWAWYVDWHFTPSPRPCLPRTHNSRLQWHHHPSTRCSESCAEKGKPHCCCGVCGRWTVWMTFRLCGRCVRQADHTGLHNGLDVGAPDCGDEFPFDDLYAAVSPPVHGVTARRGAAALAWRLVSRRRGPAVPLSPPAPFADQLCGCYRTFPSAGNTS